MEFEKPVKSIRVIFGNIRFSFASIKYNRSSSACELGIRPVLSFKFACKKTEFQMKQLRKFPQKNNKTYSCACLRYCSAKSLRFLLCGSNGTAIYSRWSLRLASCSLRLNTIRFLSKPAVKQLLHGRQFLSPQWGLSSVVWKLLEVCIRMSNAEKCHKTGKFVRREESVSCFETFLLLSSGITAQIWLKVYWT